MSSTKSEREIFMAAREFVDLNERRDYLQATCGQNPQLLNRIESLLEKSRNLEGFMDQLPTKIDRSPSAKPENLVGQTFGFYRLEEKIGEGGGGSVYLAKQLKPVERKVALKILKLGLDTDQIITRFEIERQTLALMEHPHIARVIDAGATDEGRPYFVMEYFSGKPVTEFCSEFLLNVDERIKMMIQICRAIEHAHRKGVIHRDLKPSNILVRYQDGQVLPKVIDFGVAKAIDSSGERTHHFTRHDTFIGTPEYMSPEQANRDFGIDTRTDIYSLGVILYELLTGKSPLKALTEQFPKTDSIHPQDALKIVRSQDPPRPSSFLRRGKTQQPRLKEIPEDLDWVTMKCLEKEPARRYGSAGDLANDLESFLKGGAVTARPPSVSYRLQKFTARHKGPVLVSLLLLISLIAGSLLSLLFAFQSRQAEETEGRLRFAAEQQREHALQSAQKAQLHQYVANITLAHQAIEEGNLSKARLLLEPWRNQSNSLVDLRGFEWWHLMNQCSGDPHDALPQFNSPIHSLAFSPETSILAIATEGELHLWSLIEARITVSIPLQIRNLTYLPESDLLLAQTTQGLTTFNIRTLELETMIEGPIEAFAYSKNGQLLATSDLNGTSLWAYPTLERLQFFATKTGPMSFSPDGKLLAISSPDGVIIHSVEDRLPSVTLEESPGFPLGERTPHFSATGDLIYLARNDTPSDIGYSIGIWETKNGKEIGILPNQASGGMHTSILSDGFLGNNNQLLVTGSWDHSVKLWNLETGSLERSFLGHRSEVWSVCLSEDRRFIASGSKDGEVRIWDTKRTVSRLSIPGPWKPLSFSNDSQSLIAFDRSEQLACFKIPSKKLVSTHHLEGLDYDSEVAACSTKAVSIQKGGAIAIKDLSDQSETKLTNQAGLIDHLKISPDGQSLALIMRNQEMMWLDLNNPTQRVLKAPLLWAGFSGNGSSLIGIDDSGKTTHWESSTRRIVKQFSIPSLQRGGIIQVSHDGKYLACSSGEMDPENLITLWETRAGTKVGVFQGHKQSISDLAFAPDGKTLASTDGNSIRLWNLATQSELYSIRIRGAALSNLLFSPDSRTLVTSSPGFHPNSQLRIIQ